MTVIWDQDGINKVKKDFSSLSLNQEQQQRTKYYGDFLAKYIPLDSIVIQGFYSFSIRDWEKENPGKRFAEEALGPNGLKCAMEMNEIFKEKIKKILRNEEQWDTLNDAIDKALKDFASQIL